jgi:cytochrome bd-type quinol oxidase subunit 2
MRWRPHYLFRACGSYFEDRRYDAAMRVFLTVILVFALLGVLIALGVGVATMLKGGNPRRSNKMMQLRVIMQAIALVTLAILMMMAANR